ncbi:hypothetical protein SELMODRAFT_404517 [Selaginella moellendorffii]|uniref:Uncharacterized protein n=1 Tax=Selaginella moellendorffii TaxID=88036 RepID=D8QVK9_SELML|nr:hypothetical protein SELMODRAFT_404517 [Selaginella moellendorffii]
MFLPTVQCMEHLTTARQREKETRCDRLLVTVKASTPFPESKQYADEFLSGMQVHRPAYKHIARESGGIQVLPRGYIRSVFSFPGHKVCSPYNRALRFIADLLSEAFLPSKLRKLRSSCSVFQLLGGVEMTAMGSAPTFMDSQRRGAMEAISVRGLGAVVRCRSWRPERSIVFINEDYKRDVLPPLPAQFAYGLLDLIVLRDSSSLTCLRAYSGGMQVSQVQAFPVEECSKEDTSTLMVT